MLVNPKYKTKGEVKGEGWGTYLWGNRIGTGAYVNCCRVYGDGDCQMVMPKVVEIVPGGYKVDGEFIAEADTNVSPDENYYRCQHAGMPSHCMFVPDKGM